LDSKRGAVVAGTGAGKGVIIAGICTFMYTKTLIILDSVDVAEQLAKELYQYTGISTGLIKGGRWETDQLITVAVIDSIHSKTKGKMNKEVKAFVDSIELLIIDEAHHASAPTYESFLEKCKAPYRFGLTATAMGNYYRGEKGLTSNEPLLKGLLGATVWQKTSTDLVKEGWLSVPTIYMLEHKMSFEGETGLYSDEEKHWIIENEDRNMKAAKIIDQAVKEDKNCIIFINRVEHGKIFVKMLEQLGVDKSLIRYAYGEITGADRQAMFADFKSGEARVLIGTVLNEGLNFQIDVGLNLGAGMTPRLALQRLGRILRKPKSASGDVDLNTPSYTTYYDFLDVGFG
jgi:superfamily II DNA or RNA helicase